MDAFKLTEEQKNIINSNDELVIIQAYAGTGKTTTLKLIADSYSKIHEKMILYICFGKENQLEIQRKNQNKKLVCSTFDFLSFHYFGENRLPHSINKWTIRNELKCSTECAETVQEKLERWAIDPEKNEEDLLKINKHAYKFWRLFTQGKTKFTNFALLRKYMLLDTIRKGIWEIPYYESNDIGLLLIDECQDLNPIMLETIFYFKKTKIFVGDQFQHIFSFMGTVNAFNRLKKEERKAIFSLSKSFRFNQHIANLASEIANVANNNKEEVIEIKGIDLENEIKESEVIKIYDNGKMNVLDNLNKDGERIAILAVKNQTLLTLVFELIDKYRGISFYIVGRDTFFSTIEKEYNEHYVNSGGKGKVKELLKMAEWNEDSEMMSIYQTILNYGKFLPEKIENVKKNWSKSIEDAKVIFCTIHRSKGLEFENVRLVDDHKVGSRGKEKSAKELMDAIYEKYRLYYVAVTRAKKTLWFPLSLCKEFKIRNYRGPSSRYPYRKFDCTLTKFLNAKRVINID